MTNLITLAFPKLEIFKLVDFAPSLSAFVFRRDLNEQEGQYKAEAKTRWRGAQFSVGERRLAESQLRLWVEGSWKGKLLMHCQ